MFYNMRNDPIKLFIHYQYKFVFVAEFYVYGSSGGDDTQPAGDDGCPDNYDFPIKFFGNPKSTAYVSKNSF